MSVSKRLRYEIFRRDNHTCRYCGGTAPNVALTVDHVLPTALGGSDDPCNLVAACADCNSGKSASNPNEPLVVQASEAALRWAKAVQIASDQARNDNLKMRKARQVFCDEWDKWRYGDDWPFPKPVTWIESIDLLASRGLPLELLQESARTAMIKTNIHAEDRFTYFCGVAWNKIRAIDSIARDIYAFDDPDMPDSEIVR